MTEEQPTQPSEDQPTPPEEQPGKAFRDQQAEAEAEAGLSSPEGEAHAKAVQAKIERMQKLLAMDGELEDLGEDLMDAALTAERLCAPGEQLQTGIRLLTQARSCFLRAGPCSRDPIAESAE